MVDDGVMTRRVRVAEKVTQLIESDRRVSRCKRVDFSNEGGLVVGVELITYGDAASRGSIARELEFAISDAIPALPWATVRIV